MPRKTTVKYEWQMEIVKNILKTHKGVGKAICAKEISRIVGFPLEDTQAQCRKAINDVRDKYDMPIVACSNGYYLATCREEIEDYIKSLDDRIAGLQTKKRKILAQLR